MIQLSEEQQHVVELALSGYNLFLYAKAGTGKSHTINYIVSQLQQGTYAILGTSGVAAANIGGSTFHSFFAIKPFGIATTEQCNWVKKDKRKMWDKCTTIIIDEVSMLRADVLDAANNTLIMNGCVPLTQKQIIFIGDLKQLKPILNGKQEIKIFRESYNSTCFQEANVYKELNVQEVTLSKVFRQDDIEFKEELDILRNTGSNFLTPYFRQYIQPVKNNGIVLAGYNDVVDEYNIKGLQELDEPLITYKGSVYGNFREKDYNVSQEISVKHGCKIMYLHNHPNYPLVNGTLGTFLLINNTPFIQVDDVNYHLERIELEYKEYQLQINELDKTEKVKLVTVSSIVQYPIRVAYALSINKAQGLSLSPVTIDLRKSLFAENQLYVALSRLKVPENTTISEVLTILK